MERLELRGAVYSSQISSSEKVCATQKGAKCARKHKNNNKIPVYFDNIILDGHKGRHVTSNRFRYLTALWEGFQTSFANNLLKSFFLASVPWQLAHCALPFDVSAMKDFVEIIIDKIFVRGDNGV